MCQRERHDCSETSASKAPAEAKGHLMEPGMNAV